MRVRGDKNKPLYMISVVSKMLEVHPQTIRMYEREGFVCPHRINKQRLYSDEDIETLNLVVQLTKELGVNKAGVDIILRMRQKLLLLQKEMMEVLNYLDEDIRHEFQRRLQEIIKSNEEV
ncbi:MAG: MerR family transcriptional regulator [Thermodesulfovibrionales bacterium]|nr:MerR family transcriptional regulator [Thermodesulfovibrionales bacterium]